MKLVVLGATGGIGMEIVRQAITRGHTVTAVARAPERLNKFAARIELVRANLLNCGELKPAIAGHDAALSAFGPRTPIRKDDAHLLRDFAKSLTCAMTHAEVSRVVVVSVAFLFKNAIVPPAYLLGRFYSPKWLLIPRQWSRCSQTVASTGLWCVHLSLRTVPTPARIECRKVDCRISASRSRART